MRGKVILIILLTASLYFVFFQHLDSFYIRCWDESFYAVNACEMLNDHNFIVPHFKGGADMLILKPPMQEWLQVLCMSMMGINELAIRLPSAMASALTALLLFFFFKRRIDIVAGLCMFFVFITTQEVATFHTGRTGDTDAVLTLFIFCSIIFLYKWLFEESPVSLFYFFLFLALAFLTKSFVALFFAPAFLFSVVYFKKLKSALSSKYFYAGFFIFIFLSIGYLWLRNTQNPGYFKELIGFDFASRYANGVDAHAEPFDLYFNLMFEKQDIWLLFSLPGMWMMLRNSALKRQAVFFISLIGCYLIIICFSVTKLHWYDLPLFPLLSVFSGYAVYSFIKTTDHLRQQAVLLCLIFFIPYYYAARNSYKSEISPGEKKLEILTEYAFTNRNNNSLNDVLFYTAYCDRPLYFYKYRLNKKGGDFKITNTLDSLKTGNIIIVAEDSLKDALYKKYAVTVIDNYKTVSEIKIDNYK